MNGTMEAHGRNVEGFFVPLVIDVFVRTILANIHPHSDGSEQ